MQFYRQQQGVTLISLMIGMVISLFAILACLVMFKDLIRVSGEAKADSIQESQLSTALLRAQMELQGVGFTMGTGRWNTGASPTSKDLLIENTSSQNSTISWRLRDGNSAPANQYICRRLVSKMNAAHLYTLDLETMPLPCDNTTALSALLWNTASKENLATIQLFNSAIQETNIGLYFQDVLIKFEEVVGDKLCAPYGIGTASTSTSSSGAPSSSTSSSSGNPWALQPHPVIKITKLSAIYTNTQVNGGTSPVGAEVFNVCLTNLVRPAPAPVTP